MELHQAHSSMQADSQNTNFPDCTPQACPTHPVNIQSPTVHGRFEGSFAALLQQPAKNQPDGSFELPVKHLRVG